MRIERTGVASTAINEHLSLRDTRISEVLSRWYRYIEHTRESLIPACVDTQSPETPISGICSLADISACSTYESC
jgi:hypothetical protein